MKLMYCKLCRDLVSLNSVETRECFCGNVTGHFKDNNFDVEVDVTIGNWETLRIIGIDNRLLINDSLPKYEKNFDSPLLFDHWCSAIIIVPVWMLSEVHKMNPDRFPEVPFKGDE